MTRRPLLLLAAILLAVLIIAALLWCWVGLLRELSQVSTPVGQDAPRTTPSAASRDLTRLPWPSLAVSLSAAHDVTPAPSPSGARPHAQAAATEQTPQSATVSTAGLSANLPTATQWAKLRWCESRDHYDERANPKYRGAYQIGFYEWAHYGGAGRDPADASPAEQDAVALRIWQARGWEPWQASSSCTGLR